MGAHVQYPISILVLATVKQCKFTHQKPPINLFNRDIYPLYSGLYLITSRLVDLPSHAFNDYL